MMRISRCVSFLRRFTAAQEGVSLVEFTLLLPLLLWLLGGFVEFGRILHHHQVIEKQMRATARYLARVPDITAATPQARNLALYGSLNAGTIPLISYWTDPDKVVIVGPTDVTVVTNPTTSASFTVQKIVVETAVDYQDIGLLRLLRLPTNIITLRARHEEPYIGE
ncbi:MAG TPA: TadE/TadG family type IV pilus assembly protein [Azospirillaceae bacterium]|nr:TadE/TadG family type IV pilus assembly protein [Azospirillaceae bacterium]